ncbi:hypothetical protein B7494_g7899 [Chlorociboria aeruginascens]|nr:hypothetical protein B7494_g7899 [Chlorociboria aeruginascens]
MICLWKVGGTSNQENIAVAGRERFHTGRVAPGSAARADEQCFLRQAGSSISGMLLRQVISEEYASWPPRQGRMLSLWQRLRCDIDKCEFGVESIEYLGFGPGTTYDRADEEGSSISLEQAIPSGVRAIEENLLGTTFVLPISNKAWRTKRYGFLKSLPVPYCIWSEIFMGFVAGLAGLEGCAGVVVLADRLGRWVIADGLQQIDAKSVADWFLRKYYPHHFLPKVVVSDRGTQFVSAIWKRICDVLHIQHRLSAAFSPETNEATERANLVIEAILRKPVNWTQHDWVRWVLAATSTGISPFFLEHGWEQELFEFEDIDKNR